MRAIACLLVLSGLAAAEGARELTGPDDVRARREATRERHDPPRERQESADEQPRERRTPTKAHQQDDSRDTEVITTYLTPGEAARLRGDTPAEPPGRGIPQMVLAVEQGWYGTLVANRTEAAPSGGSLAQDYEVGYELEPLRMTRISGTGRIGKLGFDGIYASDPADEAAGQLIGAGLALADLDDGGWWMFSASYARLRGTATTSDSAGDPVRARVDSRWRTVAIERRYYPGGLWGVQYEDLQMPSAYSLDDPDGQVIAIFDDTTRWRTVSAIVGVDSANRSLVDRDGGLRPLYELRVGLGLGIMSYDDAGARTIASNYGYAYDDDGGLVMTAHAEGAIGAVVALAYRGCMIEAAAGIRGRIAWIGTGREETPEGQSPDYDTLHLSSSISVGTLGTFLRLTAAF
jgi:hypothetical protein